MGDHGSDINRIAAKYVTGSLRQLVSERGVHSLFSVSLNLDAPAQQCS